MANQAFVSVWCVDFPEDQILNRLGMFLATIPFSAARPGIERITIRAIDASESPIVEQDFRGMPIEIAGATDFLSGYVHSDCSYEIGCHWDLWVFDAASGTFSLDPQHVEILCHGGDYDNGYWVENGHFQACLGFEHLFTGHAGLLGPGRRKTEAAVSLEEARFMEAMAWPENLDRYQERTRENIRKLLDWSQRMAKAVPVQRLRLWSEGEEDFEARLDEILALR